MKAAAIDVVIAMISNNQPMVITKHNVPADKVLTDDSYDRLTSWKWPWRCVEFDKKPPLVFENVLNVCIANSIRIISVTLPYQSIVLYSRLDDDDTFVPPATTEIFAFFKYDKYRPRTLEVGLVLIDKAAGMEFEVHL
jgi:hypothetical protein